MPIAVALGPSIAGGGSIFAKLEVDQWRAEAARSPHNLTINYVAQNPVFGRQQFASGALDFAVTDIPFLPQELRDLQTTSRRAFRYIPISAGGVGFMYQLLATDGQPVTSLNLDARTACRIFTDPTMMWNDFEIQALNPFVTLPHERVRAIVRSDEAGTSYALSQYCIAAAADVWRAFIAAHQSDPNVDPGLASELPISRWPTYEAFASAAFPDGVAFAVADPAGMYSITYNEVAFARIRGLPMASLENASGNFVQPTGEAVSVSLGYATGNSDGTFDLDYTPPAPGAYPVAMYSYAIAQTTGFDPAKGEVLARFLCYAVTRGQRVELTNALGYASLSVALVEIARNSISQIPGAPVWEQCAVIDPMPPVEIPEAPSPPLLIVSVALVIGSATLYSRRHHRSVRPSPRAPSWS